MIKKYLNAAILALSLLVVVANSVQAEPIEQFNHDYYTQLCESMVACSGNVAIAENFQLSKITGIESCVAVFTQKDGPQKWQDTIAQKTAVFQPKASKACLSSITEMSCKQLSQRLAKPAAIKGCEDVIVGTVADSAQCSSSMACTSSDASCYGTCERPRPLQCGDDICTGAEYCDTEKNACFSLKKNGQSCNNFSECEDGCADGICKAPLPVVELGGKCGNENGYICSIGEFCAEDQCTPFQGKGDSCSTEYDQFKQCEAPFDCQDNKCT